MQDFGLVEEDRGRGLEPEPHDLPASRDKVTENVYVCYTECTVINNTLR